MIITAPVNHKIIKGSSCERFTSNRWLIKIAEVSALSEVCTSIHQPKGENQAPSANGGQMRQASAGSARTCPGHVRSGPTRPATFNQTALVNHIFRSQPPPSIGVQDIPLFIPLLHHATQCFHLHA